MEKEDTSLIVLDNNIFHPYSYKSEEELERISTKHSKEIFGKYAVYLDVKKKITSTMGISVIPDGLLLDLKSGKFYIVEIELSSHDIISHISNQLTRFKLAMNNKDTHKRIAQDFYDKIVIDKMEPSSLAKIQQIISRQYGIIVVIDGVSEKLEEVFEMQERDGTEVLVVPFETYVDSKNRYLHKFTRFTKEALEKESKKWTFKWTTVPVEKHLDRSSVYMKETFSKLSAQICSLSNAKEKSRKGWVTYQTSPLKNFCTVKILPNCLEVHLKCGKHFRDERGITRCIKRTPAWTFDRIFTINSQGDIEYAMHLIRQAYDCVCNKIR